MSDLPSYSAEHLAANFPTRTDASILSGPYTPTYIAAQQIERLRAYAEKHRQALRCIAEFPVTLPDNPDAFNMREIARNAIEQGPHAECVHETGKESGLQKYERTLAERLRPQSGKKSPNAAALLTELADELDGCNRDSPQSMRMSIPGWAKTIRAIASTITEQAVWRGVYGHAARLRDSRHQVNQLTPWCPRCERDYVQSGTGSSRWEHPFSESGCRYSGTAVTLRHVACTKEADRG